MRRFDVVACAMIVVSAPTVLTADEPSDAPTPIPATRPAMKAVLEELKNRQPRIPLPAAGDGHNSLLPTTWGGGGGLGTFGPAKNPNARSHVAGKSDFRSDDLYSDLSFWVVSRSNNCHYCLGHQELKLRVAGLNDDTIAALDSNWSTFDPRLQAALAFARKLTLEPQLIGDKDVASLRKRFTDAEIIELSFNIALFNSANRWTDGVGLPQERFFTDEGERTLATPTSEQFQRTTSLVTADTRAPRPPLPTWTDILQSIEKCRDRSVRVTLSSEEAAAEALADAIGNRKPFCWERAMTGITGSPSIQVETLHRIMTDEHLGVRLKAELAFISAINNGAWYAAGHALRRLRAMNVSTAQVIALLDEDSGVSGPSAAHRLAGKLTANPHLITDADIADVRAHYNDPETAQILHVICIANFFDRFTESLGLPLESDVGQ